MPFSTSITNRTFCPSNTIIRISKVISISSRSYKFIFTITYKIPISFSITNNVFFRVISIFSKPKFSVINYKPCTWFRTININTITILNFVCSKIYHFFITINSIISFQYSRIQSFNWNQSFDIRSTNSYSSIIQMFMIASRFIIKISNIFSSKMNTTICNMSINIRRNSINIIRDITNFLSRSINLFISITSHLSFQSIYNGRSIIF